MGYKHDRSSLLDAAVDLVLESGVSSLTFGALARRLGIADRTVVYYFPWKAKLVEAVIEVLSDEMASVFEAAVGTAPLSASGFVDVVWPRLAGPSLDRIAPAFIEATGLAASGREPYRSVMSRAADDRVEWLAGRLQTEGDPQAAATGLLAFVDGLIVTRVLRGEVAADAAVPAVGVS